MIFYASGAITDAATLETVVDNRVALLTSFAYKNAFTKQAPRIAAMLRERRETLPYMIDSGAFTAWNKGKNVHRGALIDFYNRAYDTYADCLDFTFVSLDRIPGQQGRERTADDFRVAAEETAVNYDVMRTKVRGYVKPVYHDGDPDWLLKAYDDAPYISLSANHDMSYEKRETWVAEQGARLKGRQLHGLAMTGTRMLRTIRWHSVDSAAWVLWGAMGAIAWLRDDGSLKILACSAESPRKKHYDQHLLTLPRLARERIVGAIEARGFALEDITTDGVARGRWNILVFQSACAFADTQQVATARTSRGLFDE